MSTRMTINTCLGCVCFWVVHLLLGDTSPRRRAWSEKDSENWAWFLAILQEWNVTWTLGHHHVVPSSSGDRGVQLWGPASPPKTKRLGLLVSPGHPELPLWPALGLENGMYALHSFPGSLTRVPATLPSKECCLLILSDSGNLHSRAACQNTGQINMSFDYPLMAAKDSINLIHK